MKYKCNGCEHVFEGSSYSTKCPECEDQSVIPFKNAGSASWYDNILVWIKENKLTAVVILLILLFIIMNREEPEDIILTNVEYSIDFDRKNANFCVVHLINDSTRAKVQYSAAVYSFLKLNASITSDDGTRYKVKVNKNKIEYCESGDLTIKYTNQKGIAGIHTIDGDKIKPLKSSGECIPVIEIGAVNYKKSNCKVFVEVIAGIKHAYISINGEEGDYQKSPSFDISAITPANFDIWYYPEGFDNEKERFTDSKQTNQVLKSIADNASVPIANESKMLENKLIEIIELVKNKETSAADDLFEDIVPLLQEDEVFSISGDEHSIYLLITEIEVYLGSGLHLKPVNTNNISVTSEPSDCGVNYKVTISL